MEKFLTNLSKKPFLTALLFFLIILLSNISFFIPSTEFILQGKFQFYLPNNEILLIIILSLVFSEIIKGPLPVKYTAQFSFTYSVYYFLCSLIGIILVSISPIINYLLFSQNSALNRASSYILSQSTNFFSHANLYILYLFIFTLIKCFLIGLLFIGINRIYLFCKK